MRDDQQPRPHLLTYRLEMTQRPQQRQQRTHAQAGIPRPAFAGFLVERIPLHAVDDGVCQHYHPVLEVDEQVAELAVLELRSKLNG